MKLVIAAITAYFLWALQSTFWHNHWSKGLSASVAFTKRAVTEGEDASLKEIITNKKSLPLPILHVKFQMGRELVFHDGGNSKITDQNYRSDIFACMPWQEIRRTLEFKCTRRGYYTIKTMDLVSHDLFQSSSFAMSLPVDTSMYVYPRPADPVRLELPLKNLLGQILSKKALLQDPFEMQSIRPYQSYDSFRDINWKATARTGKMKVNVHAPTSSWQVAFLLDVDCDSLWKDYSLIEESIRLCASLSDQLLEKSIPVSIFTNGTDCLYNTPGFINYGAGREHLRSIMEMLSRIIVDTHGTLSQPMAGRAGEIISDHPAMEDHLETMIRTGRSQVNSDTTIYVLLSTRRQKPLVEAYSALCRRSPGSQWIMPYRPKDDMDLTDFPRHIQLFQWEVPYDRS